MATSITQLKSYFETGDVPTEQQFAELIDAFVHKDDDLSNITGAFAEIGEAQVGLVQDKYMSPFLTYEAIKSLTRLSTLTDLNSDVQNVVNTAINNLLSFDDADAVINTVKDVIDAFNGLQEGDTLIQLLQGKADVNHTHLFADITDMNLPNAKSDAINLNNSNILATAKAVRNLYMKTVAISEKTGVPASWGSFQDLQGKIGDLKYIIDNGIPVFYRKITPFLYQREHTHQSPQIVAQRVINYNQTTTLHTGTDMDIRFNGSNQQLMFRQKLDTDGSVVFVADRIYGTGHNVLSGGVQAYSYKHISTDGTPNTQFALGPYFSTSLEITMGTPQQYGGTERLRAKLVRNGTRIFVTIIKEQ